MHIHLKKNVVSIIIYNLHKKYIHIICYVNKVFF